MSDLLRMTGMYSGMDTESVIKQLVQVKSTKVTTLKNDQKKLEWKQSIWQDLNKRIYKLYTGSLSNMRLKGTYAKKKTTISDPTKAVITAGEGAVSGTQTLEVKELAKSGYLTGAVITKRSTGYVNISDADGTHTTLADLGVGDGTLTINLGGTRSQIEKKDEAGNTVYEVETDADGNVVKDTDGNPVYKTDDQGNKIPVMLNSEITYDENRKFTVAVSKDDTIAQVVDKFNTDAQTKGENIRISYADGKISVSGTDGKFYAFESSAKAAGASKTIAQGLSLNNTCVKGDNANNDRTGEPIQKQSFTYSKGNFINRKTGDDKYDKEHSFMMTDISSGLEGKDITVTVGKGANAKKTTITITDEMQIGDFVTKLQEAGLNASFDEKNQRFFISAASTGADNDFTLDSDDDTLKSLGLKVGAYDNGSTCTRIAGSDAKITLNKAEFTSSTNTFSVNGLSITAQAETVGGPVSVTTDTDYDGVYNLVKDFITEYNDIMNELTKLYSADSARKFNMLSDDEKDAMSEKEVEKWEQTIKDSLLRRDKDIYSVMQCFTNAVNKGYEVGGKTMYLVNFGIGTGSYFLTEKAERNALHIYGDEDDEQSVDQKNKFKAALAENPEEFIEMFTQMSKEMYTSLRKTMDGTDYRTTYKVYDDKRMKTEYDDYTKKIKEAQEKLDAYEDKWYNKFSAMEVALSKLQSSQNSLSGMLGQ